MVSQLIVKCFCCVFDFISFFALLSCPVYFFTRKNRGSTVKVFPQTVCSWACLLVLSLCALCSSYEYSSFISSCAGFTVSMLVVFRMLPGKLFFVIAAGISGILTVVVRVFCVRYAELAAFSWIFALMVTATAATALHTDLTGRLKASFLPRNKPSRSKNELEYSMLLVLASVSVVILSSFSGSAGIRAGAVISSLSLVVQTAIFLVVAAELTFGNRILYREVIPEAYRNIASLNREPIVEDDEDSSYLEIYDRLVAYFEEDRPYLNPDLNVVDVAKKIFTNKVYISKAVNICTGRNFCQFVNYYRIRYALDMFISDPSVRITHLARMAGFNTFPTFNLAFRLYMNESPRDWCRRYIQEHGLMEDEK